MLKAENRRLRFEVEQLRRERPRENGVPWQHVTAIALSAAAAGAAGATAVATSRQAPAACPHCPHCATALSPPAQAQAPHPPPTRGDGVPAVPEAQEQRPEQHGEHPGQGQQGAS
jgi:hypothetical protein